MASIFISKPGTQFGPCKLCEHPDCEKLRKTVTTTCKLCNEPIGYMRNFINDDQLGCVHGACMEQYIERELAKVPEPVRIKFE